MTPRYPASPHISQVRVLRHWLLALEFTDGRRGIADLQPTLSGSGLLTERSYFAQVAINQDTGGLTWPNGTTVTARALYELAAVQAPRPKLAWPRRTRLWGDHRN